jgi:DNA-binding transcriptional ArsR family regulator
MHADVSSTAASIAAAIGEPARARVLYCLMDGRARTATELAIFAEVSPSTASAHLQRLTSERLIKVLAQGKHRYYSLAGPSVARILESLNVLAGQKFEPTTPTPLRAARTCYDHLAGTLGVALHDGLLTQNVLTAAYELTPTGTTALQSLGIDMEATTALRRRFAYPCLDWSERRSHLGGALAAALLKAALKKRWLIQELDSRALTITTPGRREMQSRLGIRL